LLLDRRDEQQQGRQVYRIADNVEFLILSQRQDLDQSGPKWKPQYQFTLQSRRFSDYSEMCLYHQTSLQSHFTRGRVCTRATLEGRITLSEMCFITTTLSGERQERELTDAAEQALVLSEHFGIVMR
jgi:N-hydroxyarylamine O-acetyltransferase